MLEVTGLSHYQPHCRRVSSRAHTSLVSGTPCARRVASATALAIAQFVVRLVVLLPFHSAATVRADHGDQELHRTFQETVSPFLERYCHTCHSGERTEGKLDLSQFKSLENLRHDYRQWNSIL